MSEPAPITIRRQTRSDAAHVARLHRQEIREGFLVQLGPRFLSELYQGIGEAPGSTCFVAEAEGRRVVGFVAAACDVPAMYRWILGARWLALGLAAWPYVLRRGTLREVWQTLRYPARVPPGLPRAEILAIAVDRAWQSKKVGSKLMRAALTGLADRGIARVKVVVGEQLAANRYYRRLGYRLAGTMEQHGRLLNIYTIQVATYLDGARPAGHQAC